MTRPEKTFRNNNIIVSLWRNTKKVNGIDRKWRSITLEKQVKKEDGTWTFVKGLTPTDSLIASVLLEEAWRWNLENVL